MSSITTRMGDGYTVTLTADEVRRDLSEGSEDAARRGKIPALDEREIDYLFDLFASPRRIVGVQRGHEAILSKDGCGNTLYSAQLSSGVGLPLSREQAIRTFERAFGFDTFELGHTDYTFKQVKPIVALEQTTMETVLLTTIVPMLYGAMPNLGLYAQPDGPFPNPSALLPEGKVDEAREAQEVAAEACRRDIVWMGEKMAETGADGFNMDTTAAAGDAEFLAALQATEELAAKTDLAVEMGMAAEVVLGFHGQLEYKGVRLAGLWPHQQVKLAEQAGVSHLRSRGEHQHAQVDALERRPGVDLRQGVFRGGQHTHPRQRRHGRGRRAHVRGAAARRRHPGQRGAHRDRQGRRLVGGRGRSPGDVLESRACLGHGGHPHRRRPGGEDATPQDEARRGQGIRGRQAQGGRGRLGRLDRDA